MAKSLGKSQHQRKGVATDPSLRGRGPAKGAKNAGRPPDAWIAEMAALADRWMQAALVKGILDDPDHPQWMNAGKFAHEAARGRATQNVNLTATVSIAAALTAARQRATTRTDQEPNG